MSRFVIAFIMGIGLMAGSVATSQAQTASSETYRQLDLFGDVFERIRSNYVEETTDEEMIESAIKGMMSSLDPHSSYMNAQSYQNMQIETRGEFGGLGIEVTLEDGVIKVVSPIDGTPAARAGIQARDYITHLDGEPVVGMTLSDAVELMRGPIDTTIRLTIARPEAQEPFDVVITRDIIRIPAVRQRVEGDVGYIRITSFSEQTAHGLETILKDLTEEIGSDNIKGFILDLRNNPGGLLNQAVEVTDMFLDQGEIVSTRGRHSTDTQRYNARKGDLTNGKPLIVLINGGSASASEIVAGALQDHRRAIVLGTQSFGKGSVQTIIPLRTMGALRLTTARYYTPSGRSIQATGIKPDIIVEQTQPETISESGRRKESNLRGHLENSDNDDAPDSDDQDTPVDELPDDTTAKAITSKTEIEDYQLNYALDMLRAISLAELSRLN